MGKQFEMMNLLKKEKKRCFAYQLIIALIIHGHFVGYFDWFSIEDPMVVVKLRVMFSTLSLAVIFTGG